MRPTGSPLGSGATQASPGPGRAVILLCHLYGAQRANASLGSLVIMVRKQPRLSSVSSTLTLQSVLCFFGMLGD